MRKPHAPEYIRRLGELDVVIADDLDAVAPRIEKIEKLTGQRLYTHLGQRFPHRFLVIDDKPEMTAVIGSLPAAFLKREELIAEIDEGRVLALTAQREVKQASVECQRLFNVVDLDRDMVETNGTRLLCFRHKELQPSVFSRHVVP